MTPDAALAELEAANIPGKAADMAAYHKAPRRYLGVSNPDIYLAVKRWRATLDVAGRITLAEGLWQTDVHEARVAAAKLLVQARIRPDDTDVWHLIASWVPDFDAWAIADHVSGAGARRLIADPARLDQVETWTRSDHMWTKRAALVMTLPWAKLTHPKPHELAARERILGWAAGYVPDRQWFIQKAVGWWLRDFSKRDPGRVRDFLDVYGADMKAFARKEASKYL